MADFFTISGLQDIVVNGQNELYGLMGVKSDIEYRKKILEEALNKLDYLIGVFKKAESGVLSALNAKDLSDLENKFNNFYTQSGYGKFVSTNFMKIMKGNFLAASDQEALKERERYIQILNNLLGEALRKEGLTELPKDKRMQDAVLQIVANLIQQYGFVKGMGGSGKGGITWKKSSGIRFNNLKNGQVGLSFIPELMTTIVKSRMDNMITQATHGATSTKKNHRNKNFDIDQFKRITSLQVDSKTSFTSAEVNIGFRIGQLAGNTTETDAKAWDSDTLISTNNNIKYAILKELDPAYQSTGLIIINNMLNQNPYMFYSGDFSQLRGLLGEIAAIHAVADLTGKPIDMGLVQWVATEKHKGKQLSIDGVLRNFTNIMPIHIDEPDFGLQMKNVQGNTVDFVDASFESVMDKLGINTPNIENVLYSDNFNVGYEYNLETQQYVPMFSWYNRLERSVEFLQVEKQIDVLVADIESFFQQYAADFLYMGFGDKFISSLATLSAQLNFHTGGNVLYIVREQPYFASEMLIKIREALGSAKEKIVSNPFKISAYINKLEGEESKFNIIEHLNENGTIGKHALQIKTSYLFHK